MECVAVILVFGNPTDTSKMTNSLKQHTTGLGFNVSVHDTNHAGYVQVDETDPRVVQVSFLGEQQQQAVEEGVWIRADTEPKQVLLSCFTFLRHRYDQYATAVTLLSQSVSKV